jgi:hypothetical protein
VKRDDRWNPKRHRNGPVWSPQNVGVGDARQHELLPQDSVRRAVDAKPAVFDALLVGDFRVARNQRRGIESSGDFCGMHADSGARRNERSPVDDHAQLR